MGGVGGWGGGLTRSRSQEARRGWSGRGGRCPAKCTRGAANTAGQPNSLACTAPHEQLLAVGRPLHSPPLSGRPHATVTRSPPCRACRCTTGSGAFSHDSLPSRVSGVTEAALQVLWSAKHVNTPAQAGTPLPAGKAGGHPGTCRHANTRPLACIAARHRCWAPLAARGGAAGLCPETQE